MSAWLGPGHLMGKAGERRTDTKEKPDTQMKKSLGQMFCMYSDGQAATGLTLDCVLFGVKRIA